MNYNENESLTALEHVLEEFFSPTTTNARKHEIEAQLQSFKSTPQLWKLCLYFLRYTSSQYVTMFALSSLESVITQQWATIDWSNREEIKNTLYGYLIDKGVSVPHFLRGKYAKILVEIAKIDWPERYPNFFINILELLKSEPSQLIGLVLLRTTSEEFMGVGVNFENGRKGGVLRLLEQYIPIVFELLTSILENLGTKPRHTATATPPPSPTHPSSTQPNLTQQLATATFRNDTKALNREALLTVQHLFTWVPVNQIPMGLINAIFNFTNISTYAQDDDDICVIAMSTINELLYRKCSPPGSQSFFLQLFQHVVELLRDISNSSVYKMDSLDSVFVEKLSELLVLLIEQHLWRFEMDANFSAVEFLSLLFQFTMQITSIQCYLRCLAVWAAFIKQIKPENALKYSDVFAGISDGLLRKIQFSFNYSQLNGVNNTDVDEESQTEWQIFIKTSIEVIAMVAEFSPLNTFNQVLTPWKVAHDIFCHMEKLVDHQNYSLNYEYSETERLCYALRDYCTLTQTLTRFSSLFTDKDETNKLAEPLIYNLIQKLLESASLITRIRFYNLKMRDSRLTDCFVDIHSELLAALKTWLAWLPFNTNLSVQINENCRIVLLTLPVLQDGEIISSKISHSAAQLLLYYMSRTHPPYLLSVAREILQFIQIAPTLRFNDNQTNYLVNNAICNLLLQNWHTNNQNHLDWQRDLINSFFDTLTRDFKELSPSSGESRVNEVVAKVLPALAHIVKFCKDFPMNSKKLLTTAVKPTFEHALVLFPFYVKYTEVSNHFLVFFLNVLGVLQQQLGIESTRNAVQVFLQVAVSDQQTSNLAGLDKLLQILQLIVEAPGNSFKTFLPSILQLCMENVYPLIAPQANDHPDIFAALITILYSILLHRWQYFYMSQVRLGYSPGCSESEIGPDTPQKPEQLLAVLQVFGQALLQPDINIFRLSLAALEDLNNKWKLYHKGLFRDQLLIKFLTVLMQTLIDKSQALLSEDIQIAVYNMAAVNFDMFFVTFLQQFVQNLEGVQPQQSELLLRNFVQKFDKDMPTFVQHLQAFVNDAQHFRQIGRAHV